jgi:hypothetical protein
MPKNETNEFNTLNQWLGWGDPDNGLWFIGVEEGGVWKCSNSKEINESRQIIIEKYSGNTYTPYANKNDRGDINWPIAVVTAKIASLISNSDLCWQEYRKNILWLNESNESQV